MLNSEHLSENFGYRVLLIEDEPGDVALIRVHLNEKASDAFSLVAVPSLAEALDILEDEDQHPDVILLDLNLPDCSGLITLERVRDRAPDIPIVILTGVSDTRLVRESLRFGAQDYLVKSGDGHALRKAIRYAIVRHERDQTARLAEAVFTITDTGIVMLDRHMQVQQVNPAFTQLLQLDQEQIVGRALNELPSDLTLERGWAQPLKALAEQGRCAAELTLHGAEESTRILSMRAHAVYRADGSVSNYVMVFDDITLRKKAEEQLAYQATHDSLTGLPNRVLFYDRLEQAVVEMQRYKTVFALLYIDLDGFKPVNDTLGHAAGDALLVEIAQRLKHVIRTSDTVARLSGDEFAILIRHTADEENVKLIAEKVIQTISQPCILAEGIAQISASVGIACCPADALDTHHLLRAADEAMYRAKRSGKGQAVLTGKPL